jgi:hypothetical protein
MPLKRSEHETSNGHSNGHGNGLGNGLAVPAELSATGPAKTTASALSSDRTDAKRRQARTLAKQQ